MMLALTLVAGGISGYSIGHATAVAVSSTKTDVACTDGFSAWRAQQEERNAAATKKDLIERQKILNLPRPTAKDNPKF